MRLFRLIGNQFVAVRIAHDELDTFPDARRRLSTILGEGLAGRNARLLVKNEAAIRRQARRAPVRREVTETPRARRPHSTPG